MSSNLRPHRLLWSYHYCRTEDLDAFVESLPHRPVMFADSGAYSASTVGAHIDVDVYGEWLERYAHLFEVYANLDVIGDPEATWANQQKLEKRGLKPLPAFHLGADLKWLERYADAGHTYVGLGGTTRTPNKLRSKWFVRCFQAARALADKGKPVVFHGYGVTSPHLMADFPWYSVDSTSWGAAYKFATLKLFNPATGRWVTCELFNTASVLAAQPLLAALNTPVGPLLDRKKYHHSVAATASARTWRMFEDWCRKRHGPIHNPAGVGPEGLNLYMAGNAGDFKGQRGVDVNRAIMEPGLHLYLAEGTGRIHQIANEALTPA